MSIEHCDIHGCYDTDFHVEGCPRCEPLECDHRLSKCQVMKENYDDRVYVCRACGKTVG